MRGTVRRLVEFLDEHHSSFVVARLILMTGLRLREYDAATPDDAAVLSMLLDALTELLPPEDIEPIRRLVMDASPTLAIRALVEDAQRAVIDESR